MQAQDNDTSCGIHRSQTAGVCGELVALHNQCTRTLELSRQLENLPLLGESYLFASDLDAWRTAIGGRQIGLIETASGEYILALLNVCQGQYRNGFKGLRLVLELCLQSTHLSVNLVLLAEWLKGEQDTQWATLIDSENGPLSKRSCGAFFPELSEHYSHYNSLAKKLYRELSECIHGNVPSSIPIPSKLGFSKETFKLWHSKAEVVRQVIHFAFSLRYLREFPLSTRNQLETIVTGQLGHIAAIRALFEQGV